MPSIGPELPPHLVSKRKREAEEGTDAYITRAEPESSAHIHASRSPSPSPLSKARRVLGPAQSSSAPAQQPLAHADQASSESEDSEDEDNYGPALPAPDSRVQFNADDDWQTGRQNNVVAEAGDKPKPRREEWMTVPPKQDDLAARMDPTKVRARKFNTGKGAKGSDRSGHEDNRLWTETPEQKRKRLENEQLGISQPAGTEFETRDDARRRQQDEEKARKIRDHNEKHRASSLISQHLASDGKQKEDDPSKRNFDYDKDMNAGAKVGHTQKKELLKKSAQFGSRFAGGGFL